MIGALFGKSINLSGLGDGEVAILTADGVARIIKMAAKDNEFLNSDKSEENRPFWCVERYSQDNGSTLWGGIDFEGRARFLAMIKIQRMSGRVAVELAHPDNLQVIASQDAKRLGKIPGLGPKMIPQVIEQAKANPSLFPCNNTGNKPDNDVSDDLVETIHLTLRSLGITKLSERNEMIEKAKKSLPDFQTMKIDDIIKAILNPSS